MSNHLCLCTSQIGDVFSGYEDAGRVTVSIIKQWLYSDDERQWLGSAYTQFELRPHPAL
jgi:hypothetical protein